MDSTGSWTGVPAEASTDEAGQQNLRKLTKGSLLNPAAAALQASFCCYRSKFRWLCRHLAIQMLQSSAAALQASGCCSEAGLCQPVLLFACKPSASMLLPCRHHAAVPEAGTAPHPGSVHPGSLGAVLLQQPEAARAVACLGQQLAIWRRSAVCCVLCPGQLPGLHA